MLQSTALSILKTGANVFLTGEPGSGKTHTVNQYVVWLRSHGIEPAITASTGIAATHIGGITIHSWSGIGIHKRLGEEDMERLLANEKLVKRITRTSILIIDEISMLDARALTLVDKVCRGIKKAELPFGGMQVVFVGDFFQLPPISDQDGDPVQFAFESHVWRDANLATCYLTEQYRQEDQIYLDLLGSLRRGVVTEGMHARLRERRVDHAASSGHVRLYAHNMNVDRVNEEKLAHLPGEVHEFEMESRGAKASVERLVKSCLSPEKLSLKIGARVMCTKNNFEKGFVNGTLGDVAGFDDEGLPIVKTLNGRNIYPPPMEWNATDGTRIIAKITQIPLRLAWAITIHKSQGLTLDSAVMDLSQVFEYGQGYVALSRVRSLSGLHLLGYNARALQVHPEILENDQSFRMQSDREERQFADRDIKEIEHAQDDFIVSCGGKVEEQIVPFEVVDVLKPVKKKKPVGSTYEETLVLLKEGKGISEIALARSFAPSTIFNHVEKLYMDGKLEKSTIEALLPDRVKKALPELHQAIQSSEEGRLSPVYEKFNGDFSYDDIRMARMVM
ncbi:MAG: helix-turn-helix domain-containing protein [Patescibacteria group bacterium]